MTMAANPAAFHDISGRGYRIIADLILQLDPINAQTAAVLMSMTVSNTVSHNTTYKLPRAGICLNDGSWGGHVIEYNDVFDTVRETADHGPFNSWGKDRYWIWEDHNGRHDKNPVITSYSIHYTKLYD